MALLFAVVVLPCSSWAQSPSEEDYVGGIEPCRTCHPQAFESFSTTAMGKLLLKHPRNDREALGCETCHGPGRTHVEAGGRKERGEGFISFRRDDPTPVSQRNAVCLRCHERTVLLFWKGSAHEARDIACTDCHTIMRKVGDRFSLARAQAPEGSPSAKNYVPEGSRVVSDRSQFAPAVTRRAQLARATVIETCGRCHTQQRAQLMRSSHMPLREGKMDCVTCHNPHGTASEKLLKQNSVNDNCYTCHAEKRGPFLWEHAPVTENCLNCHEPHGSNHEMLLKASKPRLCQQCHMVTSHRTSPLTPQVAYVFNRSCTNCHSQIHGTNHPSGDRRFQR